MTHRRRSRSGAMATVTAACAAAALLVPAGAASQRIAVEVAGGAAVGNYTATDAGLELRPGPSLGARIDIAATPSLGGYGGYIRSTFGCDEAFCTNRDVSITSQGPVVGARWHGGAFWARGGLAWQSLDVQATGGGEDETEAGAGFELAGGLDFGLGSRFRVRPGLRWLRHQASTPDREDHVAILAFEVGLAVGVRD